MRFLASRLWRFTPLPDAPGARQGGQALIIILVFSAILGAALLSLYNVAQLSTSKQQLTDAADAAAYSGATVLAQGLNYTAYTNRAILANNATIGQMVAMRSTLAMSRWYWNNSSTAWKALGALTQFIPYVGTVISQISKAIGKFGDWWGDNVLNAIRKLAEYLTISSTAAIGLTNHAMWAAQQIQLAESVLGFEVVVAQVAKENAPEARIDPLAAGTVFGPITTVGMLAYDFKIKRRINHRTLGTREADTDEYLQLVQESGQHIFTPSYLASRNMFPNAVGLWVATGCDNPVLPGMATGLLEKPAGLGTTVDSIITGVQTVASVLSPLANSLMCLYNRQGGAETVQYQDGKLGWVALDAMSLDVPIISTFVGSIPFAGGGAASFADDKLDGQTGRAPEAVQEFVQLMWAGMLLDKSPKKWFGHTTNAPADCVEYVLPGWDLYTLSTTTRNDGTCAVLFPGVDVGVKEQGLFGRKDMVATAVKILQDREDRSSLFDLSAFMSSLNMSLPTLDSLQGPTGGGAPNDMGNIMPAGSLADPAAVANLPNIYNLTTAGMSLFSSMKAAGQSLISRMSEFRQALNVSNWTSLMPTIQEAFTSAYNAGGSSSKSGDNVPGWLKTLLSLLGMDAIIEVLNLNVTDGVEYPKSKFTNQLLKTLSDGLPPWFWDVRIQKEKLRDPTKEYDFEVYDGDLQDYHPRRYGLGPLVYAPLIMDKSSVKTAHNLSLGGELMGLPDYKSDLGIGLKALGKARIFYRQPSDHWLTRYKTQLLPNLLLPYWQVRNEGLSYADKWTSLVIYGLDQLF